MAREGLALVTHGLLHPFGYLKSRHRPEHSRDIRTLVFVHGMGANRATFFPLQGYLRLAGFTRQFAYSYRTRGSIESMAMRLKEEMDANIKGGRVDMIAHSLGGLVARTYLQKMGGNRRVDRLITIATPHLGTEAHVFLPSKVISQMNPAGAFLQDLNALAPPEGIAMTSIAGGEDLLVHPRRNALGPFGHQVFFEHIGHNALLLSPQVMGAVRDALHEELP